MDTRCQRSPPHNLRPVFSDRRRLDCVKGSARCLESGQDNAGGWAEDTLGHACHLVLCLHWPLHAPTTQGRKYVALLFCTDFALSFPRDVCRYICIKDHLMHGLQQGYFACGYKLSTFIWINCEMHLLANIQITLLQILLHNSAFLPWWNVFMCPAAAAVLRYLDDHGDSCPPLLYLSR